VVDCWWFGENIHLGGAYGEAYGNTFPIIAILTNGIGDWTARVSRRRDGGGWHIGGGAGEFAGCAGGWWGDRDC